MPSIDTAVDRGGEDDSAPRLKVDERIAPCCIVGGQARPSDGDQATAIGETGQGGVDVPQGRVGDAAFDLRGDREGGFMRTALGTSPASR